MSSLLQPPPTPIAAPLPDGPKAAPLIQLFNWISRPVDWLDACAQRYGDTFTLRIGKLAPAVFLSHPDAVQTVFKTEPSTFAIGETNGILRPLIGNESIIVLDGERHQRQRQLLAPPFHGERMRAYGDLICETTRRITQDWQVGQPFPVRPFMQEISLQVILQTVFGLSGVEQAASESGNRVQQIKALMRSLLDVTGSPISSTLLFVRGLQKDLGAWSPWGRFLRQREQLDQLLYAEIRDRRANFDPSREDILTLMLSARDEAGEPMREIELRDELMTLLVAGHETTASALTWALYWIHRLPEVSARLTEELALSQSDRGVDTAAVARLPYLNAVCQETLRLYPVAPITFPRMLLQPLTVMGRDYEPGIYLAPCIYLLHRRPELYPHPDRFQPERFLERQFSPYEYIPFGGGTRRCLGMAFAQYEMKLVLATVLAQFELALAGSSRSQTDLRPMRRGVTLAPPGSLSMVVQRRAIEA